MFALSLGRFIRASSTQIHSDTSCSSLRVTASLLSARRRTFLERYYYWLYNNFCNSTQNIIIIQSAYISGDATENTACTHTEHYTISTSLFSRFLFSFLFAFSRIFRFPHLAHCSHLSAHTAQFRRSFASKPALCYKPTSTKITIMLNSTPRNWELNETREQRIIAFFLFFFKISYVALFAVNRLARRWWIWYTVVSVSVWHKMKYASECQRALISHVQQQHRERKRPISPVCDFHLARALFPCHSSIDRKNKSSSVERTLA